MGLNNSLVKLQPLPLHGLATASLRRMDEIIATGIMAGGHLNLDVLGFFSKQVFLALRNGWFWSETFLKRSEDPFHK